MKFEDLRVEAFLDELASDSPAPGGGSVAAVCGALGTALVSMVCALTVGREKYRGSWTAMEEVRSKSESLRAEFVKLMNDDTESFKAFMAAMKLPKGTPELDAARSAAVQKASVAVTDVPLRVLELSADAASLVLKAVRIGNANAASDAGCAALLAEAAGRSAAYNVRINLPGIKDEGFVSNARYRMKSALESLSKFCDETKTVMDNLLGA
ncbi:MAG: cyclodeaminase/cyclohydrolase family protein [Synergistaceae bacterium]|jgi:glutamate formiminotransferase/formiminotetrahydrofolate cyclodeaminase|nr:cyclodeaminase/cyclohydrolase family protein [Synergistaceae bacterium]